MALSYKFLLANVSRFLLKLSNPRVFPSAKLFGRTWQSHNCGELRLQHQGKHITLLGWLQYNRGGKFFTLEDSKGATQCIAQSQELQKLVSSIPKRSVLQISGVVTPRPTEMINKKMATGEIEIDVKSIKIVNQCKTPLPFTELDKNVKESFRLHFPYLDDHRIANQYLVSDVIRNAQNFLWDQGFIYIPLPNLYHGTTGGAKEFKLAPSIEGETYFLAQSPQIYKQMVMVNRKVDGYFQLARCYRDEGTKRDRQPEFTQIDIEMSRVTQREVQTLTENLIHAAWPNHLPPLPQGPFPHMSYVEAINCYGTDKPDLRYDLKIKDVTSLFREMNLTFIDEALQQPDAVVRAIVVPKGSVYIKPNDIDEFKEKYKLVLKEEDKILEISLKSDGSWKSPIAKRVASILQEEINRHLEAHPSDLILTAAGSRAHVCGLLGRVRTFCADKLNEKGANLFPENDFKFLWVEDFPLVLHNEETGELESPHHPFTAPKEEDVPLVYTSPEQATSQHYDLVLNGQEVGGGSIRIHDPQLQRYVIEKVLKLDPSLFQDLITALEYGAPPHGGIALGLERLVAIMCGAYTIRDVMMFPKAPGDKDPLTRASPLEKAPVYQKSKTHPHKETASTTQMTN